MTTSTPIKVFGYGPLDEFTDLSPFVTKVEGVLNLAGVPYEKRLGNPRKAPRGTLPFVRHGDRTLPESQAILEYLAAEGIADLDAGLSADERAEATLVRSVCEGDLYYILVDIRWHREEGWRTYRSAVEAMLRAVGVPKLMMPAILRSARRGAVERVKQQGTGKREVAENVAHARALLAGLEHLVARHEGPWWFGAQPSSVDAVAHAFVGATLLPHPGNPLRDALEGYPRLRAWYEHAHARLRRVNGA